MKITKNKISIGKLYFKPFSRLDTYNIYVEDLKGDTLLYTAHLSAGISLPQLLKKKLLIKSVLLEDFKILVNSDSLNGDFNFQFLIDAFASKDTVKKENKESLSVQIDDIRLSKGIIRYDILAETPVQGFFDPNHIHIRNLNAELSLKSIDPENLDAEIHSFSFIEKNNFEMKDISAKITSEKKKIFLNNFKIILPHSNLVIPKASADYSGMDISHLADSASVELSIESSIYLQDFKSFYPGFDSYKERLNLSGVVSGKLPAINLEKLRITYGNLLGMETKAMIADYINWPISDFQINLNYLNASPEFFDLFFSNPTNTGFPLRLPEKTTLSAMASGSLPQMKLNVALNTFSGHLNMSGTGGYIYPSGKTHFDAEINVKDFNLQSIMGLQNPFGKTSLNMKTSGQINENGKISVRTDAQVEYFTFNQYNYQKINLRGSYSNDSIIATASLDDPNAHLSLNGWYYMPARGKSQAKIHVEANQIMLEKLNLLTTYPGAEFSGIINGNISGNTLNNIQGNLAIDSLSFKTEKGAFNQKQILLAVDMDSTNEQIIDLKSDILSGNMRGKYSLEMLPVLITNTLSQYLPAFFTYTKTKKTDTNVRLNLVLNNTENLSKTLELPFSVMTSSNLSWNYQETENIFDMKVSFPQIKIGEMPFTGNSIHFGIDKNKNVLAGLVKTQKLNENDTTKLALDFFAFNDSMNISLQIKDKLMQLEGILSMEIQLVKELSDQKKKSTLPDIYAQLKPSIFHFQNQSFNIKPAYFSMVEDKYTVKGMELVLPKQGSIKIDGVISPIETDTLKAQFNKTQIAEILELINYQGVKLKGEINGNIIINRLLSKPRFMTDQFSIKDIYIEDEQIGNLDVSTIWNEERNAGFVHLALHQQDAPDSNISGFYLADKDSVSLDADIKAININWFQPFVKDYLFGMRGNLEAKLSINGETGKPQLNGFLYLRDAGMGVRMTNVRYKLNDSIRITPNAIKFNRFRILDNMNKTMTVNGDVTHQNFKTFNVGLTMQLRDLLLLNNPIQTDSLFYGTLKASGSVNVKGNEKGLNVDIAIQKGISGKVYVQLPESEIEAQQYNYITYINHTEEKNDSTETSNSKNTFKKELPFPIKINLNAVIGTELTLGAIINPSTKDAATVNGLGNISMQYDLNTSDMKLLGDYIMNEGKVILSLKNITKKEFTIKKGSTITFKGDPLATTFDITAIYSLRADLATLDESFITNPYLPATRVPVNCILNISGNMNKMNISYNVELPSVDESVQRAAQSIMNSDEIRIKQVAYLLAMGSFYAPNPSDQTTKTSIWTSLASSTISSQLNNLLSGVLNENWTIGTNIRSTNNNFSNVEMDLNVSSRLFNNRLTINTNLGYRSDMPPNAKTNFTGDFEALYKLNKTGEYSLKFYTVTNDKYYEQALTTQGIGFVYKKEAKTFKELFRKTLDRMRRRISRNIPEADSIQVKNNKQ